MSLGRRNVFGHIGVRTVSLRWATIVFLFGCAAMPTQGASASGAVHVLELFGVLPAVTYDPYRSTISRRRPGHPYEPLPQPIIRNPDALEPAPVDQAGSFVAVPDRWRIMESLGFKHSPLDPYNQNVFKGDIPIRGDDEFLVLGLIADTVVEPRSLPTPVGLQGSTDPGELGAIGRGRQTILSQTFIASADYFIGDTSFKPPELEFKAALAFNYNRVDTREAGALQPDPARGTARDDGFIGVQELFVDKHLRNVSDRYDFDSLRVGIQPFSSDFRGFVFQDSQPGVRLFGNRDNNRWQYNFAWFRRLEKDLNSGLNDVTRAPRHDDVFVANLYRQDFPSLGFTSQATVIYNRNREDHEFYDSNGLLQRPAAIGLQIPRTYDVAYLGYNGDGHFGRINLTVSAYGAFGHNDVGVFVDRSTTIRAGFFAAEASMDFDWLRAKVSAAYASGDRDPYDSRSTGFDAILENPIFAGADTSFWIRQNIPLIGGGIVTLAGRNGLLPDLRSSKEQGQSNFDNPGLRLLGVGLDAELSPRSRLSANVNQLWFDSTAVLETLRAQDDIPREIGTDLSLAWIYRPFATQNAVIRLSGAWLIPGAWIKSLYGNDGSYYSVLVNLIFTY
ncbi:MAG: hypothetical protein ABI451_11335 [Dokdonella sp.]